MSERARMMMEAYIDSVEGFAEEAAKKLGIAVKIERESRGRYPTVAVRATNVRGGDDDLITKRVDGVKVKAAK